METKRTPPLWRIGELVVRAWTASEARAAWKRKHSRSRCPLGVRAERLDRWGSPAGNG